MSAVRRPLGSITHDAIRTMHDELICLDSIGCDMIYKAMPEADRTGFK